MNHQPSPNRNRTRALIVCGLILLVGLFVLLRSSSTLKSPLAQNSFPDPTEGAGPNAPMVIQEYSDFQCPACHAADIPLREFMGRHGNLVRLEYNDFPLKQVHRNAYVAALAANCMDDQKKFWPFHDMLFDKQSEWSDLVSPQDKFVEYVGAVGGDKAKFQKCFDDKTFKEQVDADIDEGNSLNINSTPTFFINGQRFVGGLTIDQWEEAYSKMVPAQSTGPRK